MKLEIFVGGMDQECCGPEIERYQQVRWNNVTGDDGRNYEVHHPWDDTDPNVAEVSGIEVVGTVVNIEVLLADGARVEIERVPSGSALLGLNPYDDGTIVTRWTEESLDVDGTPEEFLITLDQAR